MTTKHPVLNKVAFFALAVAFPLGSPAWADTITGSIAAAPASVNLNLSTAYAFYGINGSFTPATDPSSIGNFSTLVAVGEYTGTGADAVFNQATYNNGTTSATLSPNYSLAQVQGFDAGVATVSITTTLFATNESLSVYISGYDTAPDFSATVGSATFALNNVVLPTTADGNGTGEGHTYGVLNLAVTGTVGETLTITGTTDRAGVTGGNGYTTIAFNSVTATAPDSPDSISGSIAAAPASVNLNLSTAYAFYGINGSFTPATDPSNIGIFSTLIAVGEYTGTGKDAVFNQTTYSNETSSVTLSPNYSLAQVQGFDAGVATVSITTTLFATNESLSVYISGYDTAPDFSATIGSAAFVRHNVVLPTTADGNGTGEGHTYGVLNLKVTGKVGDVLTIKGTTDRTGVTGGNGYTTIAFNSVTATAPGPTLTAQAVAGGQIELSWPKQPINFQVLASTNVAGPYRFAGLPVTNQGAINMAFDSTASAPAKFYRLQAVNYGSIPVTSWQSDPDGATLQMNPGIMKLQVFSPGIVRVAYGLSNSVPSWSNSFSVIMPPATGTWPLTATATNVILNTGLLQVRVSLASGAVGFYDTNGAPLLLEPPGGGKSLVPAMAGGGATLASRQQFLTSPGEAFYGLGQHQAGAMNYKNTTVVLQQINPGNSDVPMLFSSLGHGILWDNPAITDVSFSSKSTVTWASQAAAAVNYYFMYGPQSDAVIADYRYLTGQAPMFGKWAWGYWQSKNAYGSQAELIGVENQYRAANIPIDNIVQDWMYWNPNPWGSDIFNSGNYPNVAQLMQTLHNDNIHMMISKWAKFDQGAYANYLQLSNAGALYPERTTGTPNAQYYDAFNPVGRQLYWQQVSNDLFSLGIDGWWLDASEPELNVNWGEYANYATAAGSGATVYNAYPLMHTTTLYQGQRGATSSKRVFILTRSAYAGQQRNAAVTWSGDIDSTWASFALQIPAGLNFCVSGIPYWNTDIGGYQDNNGTPTDPAYAELFTRWFQYGAFCPMFRVHGQNFGKEMWQFPTNTEAILVNFDQLRYHLLPYIYSVSWMVTTNGYTMMRPLVMDFVQDTNVYNIPDQYMFGPAMMASPVTQAGTTNRNVYLPAGTTWYDFWTGLTYAGGQTNNAAAPITKMPLYVPAGSIIPYGPAIQYAAQSVDPIELRVYRGANGAFTLYEDENDNYDYESGTYATISFTWNDAIQTLTIGQRQGSFPGMLQSRTFNIVWVSSGHGAGVPSTVNADVTVQYSGSATNIPFGH
ncbi:MAG TPA: TIM-barrel domain-containing protein [Verrucomicrobiae bacterium]|nr:TIM-barrel domain-containing protein [Verrucomicrobiae bacterium]